MDLTADIRRALDPAYFAETLLLDGQPLVPDGWQRRFLRTTGDVLLNCCRQSGKSTCMAILALHTIIYKPRSLVLIVSPGQRQSLEAFSKVKLFLKENPIFNGVVDPSNNRKEEFATTNGSRLVGLPDNPDAIRGFSRPAMVIEDEAARCSEELYVAINPMMAVSDGRHIQASTGNGQQGHFHRDWTRGGDAWTRIAVPASECPRITEAFLAKQRGRLSPAMYAQEYECEFTEAADQVFSEQDIAAAQAEGSMDQWLASAS